VPKNPVTYYTRLSDLINICHELYASYGVITPDLVAMRSKLTDRIVRDYLNDLTNLGILRYIGGGKFIINEDRLAHVVKSLDLEPRTQLRLDDYLDQKLINTLRQNTFLRTKTQSILKKLGLQHIFTMDFKKKLYDTDLGNGIGSIIGSRFIYSRAAKNIYLDDIYLGGSAYSYKIRDYGVKAWAVLSVAYLSSSSYIAYYKDNTLDNKKSLIKTIPELASYGGKEPFLPEEPFYELTTDFPELLDMGRKIAARLLVQLLHYRLDRLMIEEYGDKFDIYFRYGSLFPHGFVLKSKKLIELKEEVIKEFNKLIKIADDRGVILAGISCKINDNYLVRKITQYFGMRFPMTTDDNFLAAVMEDGDTTALIARESEKGRPKIMNWYEFYLRFRNDVLKVEFLSRGDPVKDYERLRDLVYSSATTKVTQDLPAGPGPVITAVINASMHTGELERAITAALTMAFTEFIYKESETFES